MCVRCGTGTIAWCTSPGRHASEERARTGPDERYPCPCGRMVKPWFEPRCRCCHLEREIGRALGELTAREAPGWLEAAVSRLRKLVASSPGRDTITNTPKDE